MYLAAPADPLVRSKAEQRERDLRNGMSLPVRVRPTNALNAATRMSWLRAMLNGPEITFGEWNARVDRTANFLRSLEYLVGRTRFADGDDVDFAGVASVAGAEVE